MKRLLTVATVFGIATIAILAFRRDYFHAAGPRISIETTDSVAPSTAAAIGAPLFPPAIAPVHPPMNPHTGGDPIVIAECRLSVIDKQEVPSQREGVVRFVGTEIAAGEIVSPDQLITASIGGQLVTFRRLREGDAVREGQLVALLDDRLSREEWAIKSARLSANRAELQAAMKISEEARSRYETLLRLRRDSPGATAEEEVRTAKLAWDRTTYDALGKRDGVTLAEREASQAEMVVRMHEIRSTQAGIIKAITKKPGEAVRALESVMQINNHGRLRVEGQIPVQQMWRLKPGMPAIIELVRPDSPHATFIGHTDEVTAVTTVGDSRNPLIVSASLDGTVRVWSLAERREIASWKHNAPVHAIACSRRTDSCQCCLTGCADGCARLWNIELPAAPPRRLAGQHTGGVTAVAVCPDGKTCLTGGEDHAICLWDMNNGSLRYRFPEGHRGSITALNVTHQCRLVSAGRDNTIRLWEMGQQGARLVATYTGRSGDIPCPGVCCGGTQMFFDAGSELRVLSMPEGRTEYVLADGAASTPYMGFAEFSPDGRLLLTAGGSRTHVWRAPAGNRQAAEIRQLIAPNSAAPTCAAFTADGAWIATGTSAHQVLVWRAPPQQETDRVLTARLSLIEHAEDAGYRQARVWAEVANPDDALVPGAMATMIVNP